MIGYLALMGWRCHGEVGTSLRGCGDGLRPDVALGYAGRHLSLQRPYASALVLLLIVPPLLLLGLPAEHMRRWLAVPLVNRLEGWLSQPLFAWILAMGMIWVWHIPFFYNATLASETVHATNTCFL